MLYLFQEQFKKEKAMTPKKLYHRQLADVSPVNTYWLMWENEEIQGDSPIQFPEPVNTGDRIRISGDMSVFVHQKYFDNKLQFPILIIDVGKPNNFIA